MAYEVALADRTSDPIGTKRFSLPVGPRSIVSTGVTVTCAERSHLTDG
jgi:hypothetical protein